MKQVFMALIFFMTGLSVLAQEFDEPVGNLQKWEEMKAKVYEDRHKTWSNIYYDTLLYPTETQTYYITRSVGKNRNIINRSTSFPTSLGEDETYLGLVGYDAKSPSGLSFFSANLIVKPKQLGWNDLDELDSLGIGLWLLPDQEEPRVKVLNYQRPYTEKFRSPEIFPYNSNWLVDATFKEHAEPIEVEVPRSNGKMGTSHQFGIVTFSYRGSNYTIPVYGQSKTHSIIRFSDVGEEVYFGGRYLLVDDSELFKPDGFKLDFNFAYDPPCAYSQAYTCSLPRADEEIPVVVDAGWKYPMKDVY